MRAIRHANQRLGTNIRLELLTRDADAFAKRSPDVAADGSVRIRQGDVLSPTSDGAYDGLIHAGSPIATAPDPEKTFREIVDGTRAIIEQIVEPSGAIPVLFTSSGAVYGRQPPDLPLIHETYTGGPDQLVPTLAYHEAKRSAEFLLASAAAQGRGRLKLGRLFAFLGPGLPLDGKYAAGNFIRDALAGGPIHIGGDGTPHRSYLYPTDMIAWCLAIFARGKDSVAYNVGSSESLPIVALAERIGSVTGAPVVVARSPQAGVLPERYVPDTARITSELGARITVGIDESIARTIAFYQAAT